jgi:hypothetical protein
MHMMLHYDLKLSRPQYTIKSSRAISHVSVESVSDVLYDGGRSSDVEHLLHIDTAGRPRRFNGI